MAGSPVYQSRGPRDPRPARRQGRQRRGRVTVVLLGRTRELETIEGFLGDVRAERGRGLLVTGEAGIGKTALLEAARERAGGFHVITTVGIEAETELPFAGLVEIANPLLGQLEHLPAPQAGAIRAALALAEHPAPTSSRLAVCAGLLGLLRSAARERPVLVLIDDAHWLDASSRECVGYAARRLDGARVGMLAAVRTDAGAADLGGRSRRSCRSTAWTATTPRSCSARRRASSRPPRSSRCWRPPPATRSP